MVRKVIAVIFALAAVAHTAATSPAWSQRRLPAPVIGVVDVQSIMQNAEAAKSIRAQIQKAQSSFQQTLQGKNDELKRLDQDLQQQRNVLAPEAYQQRRRDFEQKVSDAQRDVQERRGKLETAFSNAMQQVEAAVVQIVDQLAKEAGASLVVNKAAVLYSQGELDLTPEVMKRLNAKLPSVAVVVPK